MPHMQTVRLADLPTAVQVKITAAQASGEKVLILDTDGAVIGNITAIPNRRGTGPAPVTVSHVVMASHDGYAAHSHEIRPDHLGVTRTGSPEI